MNKNDEIVLKRDKENQKCFRSLDVFSTLYMIVCIIIDISIGIFLVSYVSEAFKSDALGWIPFSISFVLVLKNILLHKYISSSVYHFNNVRELRSVCDLKNMSEAILIDSGLDAIKKDEAKAFEDFKKDQE